MFYAFAVYFRTLSAKYSRDEASKREEDENYDDEFNFMQEWMKKFAEDAEKLWKASVVLFVHR